MYSLSVERAAERARPGENALVGVPVAESPRWMVCPACRLLAPLETDLYELKTNPFHPEKARYQHRNCQCASSSGHPEALSCSLPERLSR